MKSKIDREQLMAYLYNEIGESEKRALEKQLEASPEALEELRILKETRHYLGTVQDREVLDPAFYTTQESLSWWQVTRVIGRNILRPAAALAAAISLIILIAYVTNLQVVSQNGSFSIGFADHPDEEQPSSNQNALPVSGLTQEDVQALVAEMLKRDQDKYLQVVSNQMDDYARKSQARFDQVLRQSSQTNTDLVNTFMARMQQQNTEEVRTLVEANNANQQDYLTTILADFYTFMEDQREEDLRTIKYHLTNLKENQDIQEIETKEIIASLANQVGARTELLNE